MFIYQYVGSIVMTTIIFTPFGEIKLKSPMNEYEQMWVQEKVRIMSNTTDRLNIEHFLMQRDHIILGDK